jgi:response regulator RpfG family c-di-GMP phosphodiesterase
LEEVLFRILVVDDQTEVRAALKAILTVSGHTVFEAENGMKAQAFLEADQVDLVISDIQMPMVNGIELLTWIKSKTATPVIIITGFSHILETRTAFKLGADDFFTKPFSYKGILNAIERLLIKSSETTPPENLESLYCRIPIEDFVSSERVQINIYIRLSETKYIRVAHKGDQIPSVKVDAYKARGLDYLYARKEDFSQLVGFNMDLSQVLKEKSNISAEKKLRFLRYTTELILEHAFVNGINPKAFKQAAECLELVLSLITESQNLFEMLEILNTHAEWLYAHSLGVSVYSVMIGRKIGWTQQSTLFKLGASGLFHDIGQKEISKDLLVKGRPFLSIEERKQIETHASRGKDILLELKELSDDILQIVYEHHEDCTGQGYPRQVPSEKIHPLAKVISVADRFCYLAMAGPNSPGRTVKEVIQQMQVHHSHELDKVAFNALKSLCTNAEVGS